MTPTTHQVTGVLASAAARALSTGLLAGKLLVLTEAGDLVLVEASPDGDKELGSAHVIEGRAFTAPSFANGKVHVRNTKGDVVSLDLAGK